MRYSRSIFPIIALLFVLIRGAAAQVDLGDVLGNSGFENDLVHSEWTATTPSMNYQLEAPEVNPTIEP